MNNIRQTKNPEKRVFDEAAETRFPVVEFDEAVEEEEGPLAVTVVGPVVGVVVGAVVGPVVGAVVGPVVGPVVGAVVGPVVGPVVGFPPVELLVGTLVGIPPVELLAGAWYDSDEPLHVAV